MARGSLRGVEVEVYANREGSHVDVSVRLAAPAERTVEWPVAYVVLIDTSQSMKDFDKLTYAVNAAIDLINSMGDDDLIAVYTFDEKVKVEIPLSRVGDVRKKVDKLKKIKVGSYTLLYEALSKAINDIREGKKSLFGKGFSLENYIKKIIVITDGEPWPTYTEERWYEALGKTAFKYGITISAIGIGDDYNEKILYKLASSSGGTWYHINKLPRIEEVLVREMKRSKSVVLQRPKVKVEGGTVVEVKKLGSTVATLQPSNVVELEDVVAGESVTVVFRLRDVSGDIKVVVEGGGEKFETYVVASDAPLDKTATLTYEYARQLEQIASGGEVKIEVLRAVSETLTLPVEWREKAKSIAEKLGVADPKELAAEATTLAYPIGEVKRETPTEATQTQREGGCYVVNVETGAKMLIGDRALLGRQDFVDIAPEEALSYISRRRGERGHIEIKIEGGRIYIRDAGSTGGVYLGDVKVGNEFVEVKQGDVIDLARSLKIKIECL